MKKLLLLFIATTSIVVAALAVSCDKKNENTPPKQKEETSYEDLQESIDVYNASFALPTSSDLETRKINWKKLFKAIRGCFRVVFADISGAVTGHELGEIFDNKKATIAFGIVGAVSASIDKGITEFGSVDASAPAKKNNATIYSLDETGSVIGEAHNEIMEKIFAEYEKRGITEISSEQLHKDVIRATKQYLGKEYFSNIKDTDLMLIAKNTQIINEGLKNLSDEQAVEYFRNSEFAKKEDLNIIADYMLNIASLQDVDKRKEYAEGFSKIVKDAKILQSSKELILDGTSTAINSLSLWEIEKP